MYVGYDRGHRLVYICRKGKGHLTRSLEHLDAYVIALVLRRLATLNVDDLSTQSPETIAARAEAQALQQRLDDAVEQFTTGALTGATLAKIERNLLPKIADAQRRARPTRVAPLIAGLAGGTAAERWDALTIEQRREVVRLLADVTVLRSTRPRGTKGFDPDAVRVDWKL